MTQTNDIELATRIRRIQALAGDLDRAMRDDPLKKLFLEVYAISDEAGLAMERINRMEWPMKESA